MKFQIFLYRELNPILITPIKSQITRIKDNFGVICVIVFRDLCNLATKSLILFLIFITLTLIGCTEEHKYKEVKLQETKTKEFHSKKLQQPAVHIAIASVISPQSTLILYTDFIRYLQKKLEMPVEIIQRETYTEINELLINGDCDIAFICTGAYVQLKQNFPVEILVIPRVNGKIVYQSYIIVNRDSPLTNFNQLKDKNFAFSDPISLSGFFYPKYRLHKMGESPRSFFHKTIFTNSHDYSIKSVADNLVDGAAVDSLVYESLLKENNSNIKNTRIIERSPFFGISPVVVRPNLNPAFYKKLQNIFTNMDKDETGRNILKKISIDRFILPDDISYYEPVEKMLKELGIN